VVVIDHRNEWVVLDLHGLAHVVVIRDVRILDPCEAAYANKLVLLNLSPVIEIVWLLLIVNLRLFVEL